MTAQGHARSVFHRAIERRNLLIAETTAREIGRISLDEALALTVLVAERAPDRLPRFADRWLRLYLDTKAEATASEIAFASACLQALGNSSTSAAATLALQELARQAG